MSFKSSNSQNTAHADIVFKLCPRVQALEYNNVFKHFPRCIVILFFLKEKRHKSYFEHAYLPPISLLLYSYVNCGQVEKSIRKCKQTHQDSALIQRIKVRSFKNILPTAAIGWWHHFVKVESRVDDGADFNITSLPFSMDNFTFTFCQLVISPNLCPVFCYLFSDWKFYLSVTFYFMPFCQLATLPYTCLPFCLFVNW